MSRTWPNSVTAVLGRRSGGARTIFFSHDVQKETVFPVNVADDAESNRRVAPIPFSPSGTDVKSSSRFPKTYLSSEIRG